MTHSPLTRRRLLRNSLALGCSAAASPLVTPVTLAVTPGDARLVVIVLRGAMDGLDVVQPAGDPLLARYRKTISQGLADDAPALDDMFLLHPALAELMPLWQAGELSFAHAVSTPYRNKRSHFDGQDILENGTSSSEGTMTPGRDGWLNRMIAQMPGAQARTGLAIGRENMLLMNGKMPYASWSPDTDIELAPQTQQLLARIYAEDPLFKSVSETALDIAESVEGDMSMNSRQAKRAEALSSFAADQLMGEARVAAFSLNGWDTHHRQANALTGALRELKTAILTLKAGLGPVWGQTAVLCVTEFGRTVRENGARGTDHGTGGAAVFAGGALKGQKILGDWPGLGESDLFNNRDLMPTRDVRSFAAWAMRDMFQLDQSTIEGAIFPGLDMGSDPRLIA